jgi:hypothetical protein
LELEEVQKTQAASEKNENYQRKEQDKIHDNLTRIQMLNYIQNSNG